MNKEVIIYGADGCPACEIARKFCIDNKVEFTYKKLNVDISPEDFMIECDGVMSVPVIKIDGEQYNGFNGEIEKALLGE